MEANQKVKFKNVDEYIETFPKNVQFNLQTLRYYINRAAPLAIEHISYNMPAFKCQGMLAYFAAYKNHIGFYPTASPIAAFKDKLTKYKTSKGAIQFPLDKPIPATLVKQIIKFKLKENFDKPRKK